MASARANTRVPQPRHLCIIMLRPPLSPLGTPPTRSYRRREVCPPTHLIPPHLASRSSSPSLAPLRPRLPTLHPPALSPLTLLSVVAHLFKGETAPGRRAGRPDGDGGRGQRLDSRVPRKSLRTRTPTRKGRGVLHAKGKGARWPSRKGNGVVCASSAWNQSRISDAQPLSTCSLTATTVNSRFGASPVSPVVYNSSCVQASLMPADRSRITRSSVARYLP